MRMASNWLGWPSDLAMNSVDYYKVNDVPMEQAISRDKLEEQAKAYADTIISRLRQTEGLESIPIVIGIYEQTAQDSPIGGVLSVRRRLYGRNCDQRMDHP